MPSQPIAANQVRYCVRLIDSSPGWYPGVVLPRLTPGRNVTSPPAVCSANRPSPAVATMDRPAERRNTGAHDEPVGGDGILSMPAIANAAEVITGAGLAPARVRHMASVTTPMT